MGVSIDVLADRYLRLATSEFAGYSTLYEGLALSMAADVEALELIEPLGDPNQTPVRLFACVHDLTLDEPDLALARCYRELSSAASADLDVVTTRAWPLFRSLLFERREDLVHAMGTRTIQTNEVGRVSALVPALTDVARRFLREGAHRPISLIEIGPSAGLNLLADQYRVDYSDGRSTGPVDAGVVLHCDVLGPNRPPLPDGDHPLDIGRRVGIDLAPLDVTVDDDCRWLEACVWPGLTERSRRLRGAIALARQAPPLLHRGSALDLLAPVVDQVPEDELVVIVSTWVLAYFSKPERLQLHDVLAEIGARRDVAFIAAEYPTVTPWAPEPDRAPAVAEGKGATLISTAAWHDAKPSRRSVAWMQAHGLWLDWLEG